MKRRTRPRPIGKHWQRKPAIITKADGREICNRTTQEGRFQYSFRIMQMWTRQNTLCCNCRESLELEEACFEHENGRTAGKRDDRIQDSDGNPINGASHGWCNSQRGSRRTPIWKGAPMALAEQALLTWSPK